VVVLAPEGLQDLLAVVAVPWARFGGEPFDLRVEQVDDGIDAVTVGALAGSLEEVEASAHGSSNGVAVASGACGGEQWADGLAERVDLIIDRATRAV
jgi:hypothetical protein